MGKFDLARLDDVVQDWKERSAWACGPPAMLDSVEKAWDDAGLAEELHMERFTIARTDKGGEGGTVTFALSDKSIELDGATSLLEGGEKLGIQMPFGCRMGICQSCFSVSSRWNPATCVTSGPVRNTARATASKHASPRHPATLHPQDLGAPHGYHRHQAVRPT